MNKQWAIAVLGLLWSAGMTLGQQPDRRRLDADFRLASSVCRAAADSGSLTDVIDKLNRIVAQDASYPEAKALLDSCGETLKKLKIQEDQWFDEAKSALQRGAAEEARAKFQVLANKNGLHNAAAKSYLSRIALQGASPAGTATQQDFDNMELAKKHLKANNFDKAKPLFEVLVNKGGTLATEARKYLDQIDLRNKSQLMLGQGMQSYTHGRWQEALDTFLKIEQQDPGFSGVKQWIARCQNEIAKLPPQQAPANPVAVAPPPAKPADNGALQRGKALFEQKDFAAALKQFQTLPDLPESQTWIQKTETAIAEADKQAKVDKMVKDGEALLRRKEFAKAEVQFKRALIMAPRRVGVSGLLAQAQEGMKESGQTSGAAERSAYLATFLENGVREFYAGNYSEAGKLLEQYVQEKGPRNDLAYFFLGAAASTEFFLQGGKNQEQDLKAQEFFKKARGANAKFAPPRDWISPKIISQYERVTASR